MCNPNMNPNFISEVGAERHFCRSYLIRYEVILQVKLSYFSLLKDNKKSLTLSFDTFKITEVFRIKPIKN